jgi:hypothetical protein
MNEVQINVSNLQKEPKFASGITATSVITQKKSEYVILEFTYELPPSHPVVQKTNQKMVTVVERIVMPKESYDDHVKGYLKIRKLELDKEEFAKRN